VLKSKEYNLIFIPLLTFFSKVIFEPHSFLSAFNTASGEEIVHFLVASTFFFAILFAYLFLAICFGIKKNSLYLGLAFLTLLLLDVSVGFCPWIVGSEGFTNVTPPLQAQTDTGLVLQVTASCILLYCASTSNWTIYLCKTLGPRTGFFVSMLVLLGALMLWFLPTCYAEEGAVSAYHTRPRFQASFQARSGLLSRPTLPRGFTRLSPSNSIIVDEPAIPQAIASPAFLLQRPSLTGDLFVAEVSAVEDDTFVFEEETTETTVSLVSSTETTAPKASLVSSTETTGPKASLGSSTETMVSLASSNETLGAVVWDFCCSQQGLIVIGGVLLSGGLVVLLVKSKQPVEQLQQLMVDAHKAAADAKAFAGTVVA
jgi:hypothetical protein